MKTCRQPLRPHLQQLSALLATTLFFAAFCVPVLSIQQSLANDAGSIELRISSDTPSISNGNRLYSLAGARFGVYLDYQCTQKLADIVTDETGCGCALSVEPGRYFVKQELASPGFAMTTRMIQADVPVSKTTTLSMDVTPCFSAPKILLREADAESDSQCAIGGARFGNAIYSISYYDSLEPGCIFAGPTRTWKFRSDSQGNVTLSRESLEGGSPLYAGPHDLIAMPIGTYSIAVEQEPLGYICASPVLNATVSANDRASLEPLCEFPNFCMRYQVMRGDVMFRKTDAQGNPLAGIPFLLSLVDEENDKAIESHVLVTDAHGDYCSHDDYVSHAASTNRNDDAVMASIDSVYKLDESKLSAHNGIWFSKNGEDTETIPLSGKGALPYGSYVLQELPSSKNAGMNLNIVQFSIHRDDFVVKLDNIVNTMPMIFGYATDSKDGDKLIRPDANAVVKNRISYQNLIVGKPYSVICSAVVSTTGKNVRDNQGMPAFASTEFVPTQAQGSIIIELPIDATGLAGERIEVVAELKSNDGTSVTQSLSQAFDAEVQVEPEILASVCDARDDDKYCMGKEALARKRVEYEGLETDTSYTLLCSLQDKATGNAVRDALGNAIATSIEFMPETACGSVDLELPFDADSIAGHDIVVFDRIIDEEGVTVARHQDIDDFDQTVKTVKISSSATDKADGDKQFDANATSVTIRDTVSYANLIPGHQYELQSALMDKDTGCALVENGAPVSASASFVAQEISGSVDVEFCFDASAQTSQAIVAFESLEHEGNVIAEHKDLDDVAQTVTGAEVDPDSTATIEDSANPLGGSYGSGKPALTGDQITRLFLFSLLIICGIAICIAYMLHMRRRTLEAIARIESITQVHERIE